MSVPRLILLRHGQTVWNVEGRVQGHRDSPLTMLGRQQATAQGRLLRGVLEDRPTPQVMCSPLGRARATATIALRGRGLAVKLDARLKEVFAGDWEGLLRDDIYAQASGGARPTDEFSLFLSAPRGERIEALRARCESFLDDLSGPTVVITHGVTSLMLRALVTHLPHEQMVALPREQGCLYVLENGSETILRE